MHFSGVGKKHHSDREQAGVRRRETMDRTQERTKIRVAKLLARICPFCGKALHAHDEVPRVQPQELCAEISSGKSVVIFDVRHPLDTLGDSRWVPGAKRVRPQDLAWGSVGYPPDEEIVIYCAMPKQAASDHAAHLLKHRGFKNVRVLEGGFAGWREAQLPLVDYQLSGEERSQSQLSACRHAVEVKPAAHIVPIGSSAMTKYP